MKPKDEELVWVVEGGAIAVAGVYCFFEVIVVGDPEGVSFIFSIGDIWAEGDSFQFSGD